jgi:hypothetical protein
MANYYFLFVTRPVSRRLLSTSGEYNPLSLYDADSSSLVYSFCAFPRRPAEQTDH